MRRYDSYKDSGIEWIGEIPSHWVLTKLKFVGESIIGIIYSPDNVVNEGEGTLVLRSSNIHDGKLAFDDCVYVNKTVHGKHLTKEGDILLCARNGSAHLVGKAAYIEKSNEGFTFGAFMSIVRSELDKFLFYFFSSQMFKAQTGLYSTSTINQLTSDTLNNMFISFPRNEQEKTTIATFLDNKTGEIDELIADKKRLLELYEEEKTAIINQAVTKGINPDVALKDSGIEWLGQIPEHWELKKLRNIGKVQTGRTPKIQNSQIDFFENGEFNWFTPSDFDGNSELMESKRKLNSEAIEKGEAELFPENSIFLVSIGATLGKVSFFRNKASANQQINIIVFNQSYNPFFGYYFILGNKEMISLEADFTTLPILNQSKTKSLIFTVPPHKEQQLIAQHIETECTFIDAKISKTEKLIDLLTEYRMALISEAVTGKIKVID